MIKYPLNNNQVGSLTKRLITQGYDYPVNPYGTEEVLISDGCSPILSIDYGNEVQEDANFVFRPTKGELDLDINPIAKFEKISGNTVVWNQYVKNGDFSDGTNNWVSAGGALKTITVNNGECTIQKTGGSSVGAVYKTDGFIANTSHKYYICATLKTNTARVDAAFGFYAYTGSTGGNIGNITQSETFIKIANIVSPVNNTDIFALRSGRGSDDYASSTFKNVMCIDLTLIYGEGNEPTTPEQFEADYFKWFGKPLTYEPYNEGELIPVKMTGLKTVGFNQWDEEYLQNSVLNTTGGIVNFPNSVCAKNYIKCIPLTDYYIYNGTIDSGGRICFYDINKTFISTATNITNATITTPADAYYLKISFGYYGSTYNNDICINLSDTSKNGTYEPYKSTTRYLDVTTLKGKLDVESSSGTSVVIFPDGMKSAGSVHDEIINDNGVWKAIKRVGSVDLGDKGWNYYTDSSTGTMFKSNALNPPGVNVARHIISVCGWYRSVTAVSLYGSNINVDKVLSVEDGKYIKVHDFAYTDATTFKTAMSGVMLYYELETPLTYILDDNSKEVKKVYQGTNVIYQATSNLADTSQA